MACDFAHSTFQQNVDEIVTVEAAATGTSGRLPRS